jgi:hypothetical protein
MHIFTFIKEMFTGPSLFIECPRCRFKLEVQYPRIRRIKDPGLAWIKRKIGRRTRRFLIYEVFNGWYRPRSVYICWKCGLEFDQMMEGMEARSRFVDDNRFKLVLILGLALIVGATIATCTAFYQWKQVEMARNGYETKTVPSYNGTVTEWIKSGNKTEPEERK